MRHRINGITGIGNPEPCKLDNNITIKKDMTASVLSDSCYFFKANDLLQDPLSIPYSVKTPSYIYHVDDHNFYISGLLSLTNG